MIKQNQRILNMIHLLSDAFLTVLAYFAAIGIRFGMMDGNPFYHTRNRYKQTYCII